MAEGFLIVLSAPSGSGKTSIAKAILQKYPDMLFSVSATTRSPRGGEQNGKDYFFLSREEFLSRKEKGDLVEWEEIYGDYYGTLKSEVDKALGAGRVMMFDVDVKGALSIKKKYPRAVLIFIRPPGIEALRERLVKRKTEGEEALRRRIARAEMELQQGGLFDYQVVNDDLQKAIAEVDGIIRKHTKRASTET